MNCANHPEVPVSAYCQTCGKALCQECVRSIGGVVYCEPCLTARVNAPGGTSARPVYVGLPATGAPNPALALGLGFIPGVGAMYNGQFVKGLAHVVIFALLVSLADHEGALGILVAFWIAYQVFDAYQTARARRDGTPLPNPFGLNDLGHRLGLQQHPEGSVPPAASYPPATGPASPGTPYAAGEQPGTAYGTYAPPSAGFSSGFVSGSSTGVPPRPPFPAVVVLNGRNDVPTGAIILIGLGVLFLLGSLGIFHEDWIGRSWPLMIIAVGVWLVIRRTRETRQQSGPGGPGPGGSL